MRPRQTLLAFALLVIGAAGPAVADANREATTAQLTEQYIRTWTSNGAGALQAARATYAPQVRFYGRVVDREQLRAEKRRALERWPVRRYSLRPGTVRAACEGHLCTVRALLDWQAEDPRRRAVSQGVSSFEQTFAFPSGVTGARPAVVAESGRVLSRRS